MNTFAGSWKPKKNFMEKYSNCCGAEIINEDIEVCPQCKEPCEFIDGEEEDIELKL